MSESMNPLGTGWQPPAGNQAPPAATAPEPTQQVDVAAPAVAGDSSAENPHSASATETTEVDSGDDSGQQPEGEQQRPAGRNWAGRKIDTLTRELAEERRRGERATAIAEAVLQRTGIPAQQQPRQQQPAAPRREDFNDIEAYFDAKATYTAENKAREMFEGMHRNTQEQQRAQQEQAHAAQIASTFNAKMTESAKAYPDFKRVVLEEGAHIPVGNAAMGLAQADNPAGVMMYLATHADVAEKIAQMHPVSAAREIGRIEASIGRPQVSNAPPPGKPNGSRPSASGSALPENHTNAQYNAWAAKNLK